MRDTLARWLGRAWKAAVLFGVALALADAALMLRGPECRGRWNGWSGEVLSTWGCPVRLNEYGFREREVAVPKPPGTWRVLVLGDAATWGAGLAAEERFTSVAEARLRETWPGRKLEVLNAGLPGASLADLRAVLEFWCAAPVEPDLVVVAYGAGLLRTGAPDDRPAWQAFARQHAVAGRAVPRALESLRLTHLAAAWRDTLGRWAERRGAAPSWFDTLARAHDPAGPEWAAGVDALRGVRAFCAARNLPPPIFLLLNPLPGGAGATPPERQAAQWLAQAGQAAAAAGWVTAQAVAGADAGGAERAWYLNPLNGLHPRGFQPAYARTLAEAVAREAP